MCHTNRSLRYTISSIIRFGLRNIGNAFRLARWEYAKGVLRDAAEAYGMWVDTLDVRDDHMHIFLEAPPRYSPARVVQILKSISAREIFRRFPWLRSKLWGGELWEDGYFVRSVGDEVTSEIIRRYIRYQDKQSDIVQLKLWDDS